jgi:glutamine synthetase
VSRERAHERAGAVAEVLRRVKDERIERVRIAWCDLHGVFRSKTLMPHALADALAQGVGMVSTLMLKDSSDRTAYPVFEPGGVQALPGFGFANNLQLMPDPASFRPLPWASGTAWLQGQLQFADGSPVPIDPRHQLTLALQRLKNAGFTLKCGLEVEFHIYRIDDDRLDPQQAAWPGEPPHVSLVHPGYMLLADGHADLADEALRIVEHTALGLGLPLRSLEIELGPSQFEAVFDAVDAMQAADQMVLFRNGVKQALRRAGYHASFMCRPPFDKVMASGWHLHHSLLDLRSGDNAFMRAEPAAGSTAANAAHTLSTAGEHWLAGLLVHARGMASFCTSTVNGYGRFQANAMAPLAALWGRDNRGAMLRVLGSAGDPATRIENRIGEPMANPYLYIAAQVHAGLDGMARQGPAPLATEAPYARLEAGAEHALPRSLGEALDALAADSALTTAFGPELVDCWSRIKRSEQQRFDAAGDKLEWQRREYFSRF